MTTIVAFSAQDVSRLTGLSLRQLASWDRDGFFVPHYANEDRRLPYSRVYDFRDVVGLRTLAHLRSDKYNISRQELKKMSPWLKEHHETPWSSLRFFVGGGKVYFDNPETGARMAGSRPGQTAFPFEMEAIEREMSEAAEQLKERTAEQIGRVVRSRHVLRNQFVLDGTRIPTAAVWNYHEDGYDTAAILRAYPRLTPADIDAALAHERSLRQQRAG